MIPVTINGTPKHLPKNTSIQEMLTMLAYDNQWSGVAVNTTFIAKKKHHETIIKAGDEIEILSPIAGG